MEHIKTFLDTSTIHGLSWITNTRRWSRLFWFLVVLGGFSAAGYLIVESFDSWSKSPVSTSIESLPISEIRFPTLTVCPPKNSFLNLNYDIFKSVQMKIEKEQRTELFDYAIDIIQKNLYNEVMKNLSMIEDPNRYQNWYHGFTKVSYPKHEYKGLV